jgi:hypothetical protein
LDSAIDLKIIRSGDFANEGAEIFGNIMRINPGDAFGAMKSAARSYERQCGFQCGVNGGHVWQMSED